MPFPYPSFCHPQSHPTTVQPFLSIRATHQGSIQRSESAGWSLIWGHSQNKGPRTMQLLSKGPPFWEWSPAVGLPIIKNRAKVIINLNTQYIWSVSWSVVVRLTRFRKTWMETKERDQSPSVKDDCSCLEYVYKAISSTNMQQVLHWQKLKFKNPLEHWRISTVCGQGCCTDEVWMAIQPTLNSLYNLPKGLEVLHKVSKKINHLLILISAISNITMFNNKVHTPTSF